ncbi:MAG TPA: nucleoside-diphosphate sugar epimerase/dehydratase [Pyrinomonadaceae bacterium]|nr:nucleoside-diphosphate sugar epimerase/dehydratase [Pyrinomonadaceae bacterium]
MTKRIQFVLDLSVLMAGFLLAYLLRFEFDIPRTRYHAMLVQLICVVFLQFIALYLAGVHSFVWRYVGLAELRAFFVAAASVFAILILLRFGLPTSILSTWRVPLSICVMDTVLAFGGVLALRVVRRTSYEVFEKRKREKASNTVTEKKRVLLIGAGRAGVLAAKEIATRGDVNLDVAGFIDDDRAKQGSVINRVKVLGTTKHLPRLARHLEIDHVIITIAQASRSEIQRIAKICEEIPIKVRIIPGLYEILEGRVAISRIRDVQIEDLLGREPVQLDVQSISRELAGKTVMVTGAGGSIGSELARQVLRFAAAKLLLVERAEFALFNIDNALRETAYSGSIVPLVADIGDAARMRSIFEVHRPHVVIHAAAHKHVPLMESNPCEAIKNNVLNTLMLSELSAEFGAEAFVMISTDKAVRPTSIMGASKRLAELVVQDVGSRSKTRFVAVRFGNVIGSNGSAIPIFQEQIRRGGPLTITDKRMRRYFMTIPEAAQLVLEASTIGNGGEVFILHMGEPVSIMELAEALISLSGMKPHEDIKIVEVGMRPGEKLSEELNFETEATSPTSHPKIFISKLAPVDPTAIQFAIRRLRQIVDERDEQELRRFLNEIVSEARIDLGATDESLDAEPLSIAARRSGS